MPDEPPPLPDNAVPPPLPEDFVAPKPPSPGAGGAWLVFAVYLVAQVGAFLVMWVFIGIFATVSHQELKALRLPFEPLTLILSVLGGGVAAVAATAFLRGGLLRPGRDNPIGLAPARGRTVYFAALRGFALAALYLTVTVWAMPHVPSFSGGETFTMVLHGGWPRLGWILLAVIIVPPIDEFVFRGVLFSGLDRARGREAAVAATTVLFAAVHLPLLGMNAPALAAWALLGLALAIERTRSGSLLPAWAMHTGFTAALALFVLTLAALESGGNPLARLAVKEAETTLAQAEPAPAAAPEATSETAPEPPSLRPVRTWLGGSLEGARTHSTELLDANDFSALDDFIDELRTDKLQTPEGFWHSNLIIEGLALPASTGKATMSDWERHLNHLQAWVDAYPKSVNAHTVLANAWMQYAFSALGGKASAASYRSREVARERRKLASKILGEVMPASARTPEWYMAKLQLAYTGDSKYGNFDEIYGESIQAFPDYLPFDLKKALYLRNRDDLIHAEAFANRAANRFEGARGNLAYARIGSMFSGVKPGFWHSPESDWPRAREGFQMMVSRYPDSVNAHSLAAFNAWHAGDQETTRKMLTWLFNRVDIIVWDPSEYRAAWRWAFEEAEPPAQSSDPNFVKAGESGTEAPAEEPTPPPTEAKSAESATPEPHTPEITPEDVPAPQPEPAPDDSPTP